MVDRECNYSGCKNVKKEHEMFPYPVNDWSRLNLWLLNTGNLHSKEFHDKFICSKHFHWAKFKCDTSGRVSLTDQAVPRRFGTSETETARQDDKKKECTAVSEVTTEEPDNFCVKRPAKVYVKKKTNNMEVNTMNSIIKTEIDFQDEIKIKKETEHENVHTFDANDVPTDIETDIHTIDIFNPYIIKVENENNYELQHNFKAKELNIITGLHIKKELLDMVKKEPQNEYLTELNKLDVELEMQFTNDPNYSLNFKPLKDKNLIIKEEVIDIEEINSRECKHELNDPSSNDSEKLRNGCKILKKETNKDLIPTQEKIQLTEEIIIKEEYATDIDIQMSQFTDKHTILQPDADDIKKECIKYSNPQVEYKSEIVECNSEMIECGSNTLKTEPEIVDLTDDVDKQKKRYMVLLKDKLEPLVLTKIPRRSVKIATRNLNATKEKMGVFFCGPCNIKFNFKNDLQQHNMSVHCTVQKVPVKGKPGYRPTRHCNELTKFRYCKACDMKFMTKRDKYAHMSACHGQTKPFECSVCFESYKYEFQLIAHKKLHSGKDFRCDHCGRRCKTRIGLANHLNSHTKERMFPCPTCQMTFTERTRLLNHLIKHTPNETYPCLTCRAIFENPADLRAHTRIHTSFFPCKVCGAKLANEIELDEHMKVHTKFLECTFCLKQFKDVGELQKHTKVHEGMVEKVRGASHSCTICGARFLYRSVLVTHAATHSPAAPLACALCPRRFKTRSARNEHARGHLRRHKCPECGKSFARLHTLELHRRIHTGEKPFACHLCPKAFAQRFALNYHLRKFHGELNTKSTGKPKDKQKNTKNQK